MKYEVIMYQTCLVGPNLHMPVRAVIQIIRRSRGQILKMSFDLHTVYFDFRNIQMWLLHKKSIISTLRGLCIQVT